MPRNAMWSSTELDTTADAADAHDVCSGSRWQSLAASRPGWARPPQTRPPLRRAAPPAAPACPARPASHNAARRPSGDRRPMSAQRPYPPTNQHSGLPSGQGSVQRWKEDSERARPDVRKAMGRTRHAALTDPSFSRCLPAAIPPPPARLSLSPVTSALARARGPAGPPGRPGRRPQGGATLLQGRQAARHSSSSAQRTAGGAARLGVARRGGARGRRDGAACGPRGSIQAAPGGGFG